MKGKSKIILIGNKDCPRLRANRLVGLVETLVLLPGRNLQAIDNLKLTDMDTKEREHNLKTGYVFRMVGCYALGGKP